ncbi:hypothetical protein LJK87_04515 [Paenibacillus sp. P25]|nr:hypothetical protein LJK87_04515 [Paenibacillus sp. P25]
MVVLQIAGGILLALMLWGLLKLTFKALLWVLGLTVLVGVLFPGLLILLGGLVFVFVSLLATFGLLVLISAAAQLTPAFSLPCKPAKRAATRLQGPRPTSAAEL